VVKRPTTTYTDDQAKEAVLSYLHQKWKNALGMKSSKPQINEIRTAMKAKGLEQKQVRRNLQYLIDTGWVQQEVKTSAFHTGKRMVTSERVSYMISSQGIDYFEGRSKFEKREGLAGIRIENVSGIVIIGNNNYARQEYVHLFKTLEELDNKIRLTDQLTDEQKLDYSADLKTIQSQLAKANPDKGIIAKLWGGVKGLASIGSFAGFVEKAQTALEQVFGSLTLPT
jgi:hypothetical protein